MTSLFLATFFCAMLMLGLRRPFIWVLVFLYVDILGPQKISYNLLGAFPVSLIAFSAAFLSWLAFDRKDGTPFTFRQGLILALLIYGGITTMNAAFPEAAMFKWEWVWKVLLFAVFLPFTLRTRLRIEAAIVVVVLTLAAIIIPAGIKTVFGGGGYGTLSMLVNDNTGLYESSIISTFSIAVIPLIIWLMRKGTIFPPRRLVTLFGLLLILACLLIPIGTAARTGLLCIGFLAVLMMRNIKYRFLYLGLAGLIGIAAIPFLPQSYTERMSTIKAPTSEQSASSRLAVWQWTIEYAAENPFGGGFDAYRGNSFTYDMPVTTQQGNTQSIEYQKVTDKARAFHSSYFEMLGEQGWPGLFIWLLLHVTGVIQMERLARRWKRHSAKSPGDPSLAWQAPLSTALQQAQLIYLLGSVFVGIAYQPAIFILIGFQIALANHCRAIEPADHKTPGQQNLAGQKQAI